MHLSCCHFTPHLWPTGVPQTVADVHESRQWGIGLNKTDIHVTTAYPHHHRLSTLPQHVLYSKNTSSAQSHTMSLILILVFACPFFSQSSPPPRTYLGYQMYTTMHCMPYTGISSACCCTHTNMPTTLFECFPAWMGPQQGL